MSFIYTVDVSTVTEEPQTYTLQLSQDLCDELAARFQVHAILSVNIEITLAPKNTIWELTGRVDSTVEMRCVKSNQLFISTFQENFFVILSYTDIDDPELDVELLEKSTVDIGDIAVQYLALAIPTSPLHPELNTGNTEGIYQPFDDITAEWKQSLLQLKQPK